MWIYGRDPQEKHLQPLWVFINLVKDISMEIVKHRKQRHCTDYYLSWFWRQVVRKRFIAHFERPPELHCMSANIELHQDFIFVSISIATGFAVENVHLNGYHNRTQWNVCVCVSATYNKTMTELQSRWCILFIAKMSKHNAMSSWGSHMSRAHTTI